MAETAVPIDGSGRAWPRILGAAAISAAILAVLLVMMPWPEVSRLWRHVSPGGVLAAAMVLGLSYAAAGVRLLTMLPAGAPARLRDTIAASLWHGLAMAILPVRLGELALIDGLRRYAGVGAGSGLAVLLVQRIYDLLLVSFSFGLGVVALLAGQSVLLLMVVVSVIVLIGVAWFLAPLLNRAARFTAGRSGAGWQRLHAQLTEAGAEALLLSNAARVPIVIAGTVLHWVMDFAALWLVFRAFDVALDPVALLFLAGGLAFVHAVPLPTIGGLGLAEGGLAGLLALTGVDPARAIGLGLSVRLTFLLLHGVVIAVTLPLILVWRRARGTDSR